MWPLPPFNVVWNFNAWRPCSLSKSITALVALFSTVVIPTDWSKFSKNWFVVSLVILFFKSLVTTSPIGNLFAYDEAAGGFASTLSRSYSGYKFTIFWLYLFSTNSLEVSSIALLLFNTNKWYTPSWTSSI